MTRIIAGYAGSLALQVPRSGTRPTSDRVREGIFSALDARGMLPGARVLDLYAGSGALGLEAASRGAAVVVLVERGAAQITACRRNAAVVGRAASGVPPRIEIRPQSVQSYLDSVGHSTASGHRATEEHSTGHEHSATGVDPVAAASAERFDLAFLDPPYDLGEGELAAALHRLIPLLSEDAIVVVERSTRTAHPTLPAGLVLERSRSYGETGVHYLRVWDATARER